MPLDSFCMMALRDELAMQITEMRVDKVQQPERDEIVLVLRGAGTARLLLCAGTGRARVHLTEAGYENPQTPPMFCMLLRKHLTGARLKNIMQPSAERILHFVFDAVDNLGDPCEKYLIFETFGRYSNIILLNQDKLIIDCLFRCADVTMRPVLPGLYYREPPKQDKYDPQHVTIEQCETLYHLSNREMLLDKWILDTFGGFSPLVCREIVFDAYGESHFRIFEADKRDDGKALISSLQKVINLISSHQFIPYLLVDCNGKPYDFSYMPIQQYGEKVTGFHKNGFSELLSAYYTERSKMENIRQRGQQLIRTAKNARDRTQRRLNSQKEELKRTEDREQLRIQGELITANLYKMQKGMSVLRTQDYYSAEGQEREIPLDPLKTPQQNAAKYYKDYTKAKKANHYLTEIVQSGEIELDYLNSVLEELSKAESEKDLTEIRQELIDTGYLKQQKTGKKTRRLEQKPIHFISSSGFSIWVGRNNVQNERLTYHLAFKRDIWLHAQKIHGSHVIISAHEREVDSRTLEEAASLAAYYSQGRDGGKIPVDYTLVKNVKKIPGGKPGMVTYTQYNTIQGVSDENLVKALKSVDPKEKRS